MAIPKRSKLVWSKQDRKGPVDIAKYVRSNRRILLKVNEFGFRPKAPLLGGVAPGPIHVIPKSSSRDPRKVQIVFLTQEAEVCPAEHLAVPQFVR
jgi:hypothetical protein